ncbi:MAG: hypothetical protein JOZ54_04385, partial [Acidobacteria bacterium]|nr:hypothetical protein [Acidobacteriota bacterium]
PYNDLGDAIAVARKVWSPYAGECDLAQLAGAMGQRPKSGAFRTKVLAANMFGLTQGSQKITLTTLGKAIVADHTEASARAEAFLKVPLYKAIYDNAAPNGGILPDDEGLDTLIERLGVVPNQVLTARSVFRRSAKQAGYFAHGTDRLVRPAPQRQLEPEHTNDDNGEKNDHHKNDSKNGDGVESHPLMVGLLQSLPKVGAPFPARARDRWLNAVSVNFDFIYGPADDDVAAATRDDDARAS